MLYYVGYFGLELFVRVFGFVTLFLFVVVIFYVIVATYCFRWCLVLASVCY